MTQVRKKLNLEMATAILVNHLTEAPGKLPPPDVKIVFNEKYNSPLLIEGNNAKILTEREAIMLVMEAGHKLWLNSWVQENYKAELFLFTHANARAVLKSLAHNKRLENKSPIKPFAFASDPALTICRIPFDPYPAPRPTPHWDRFFTNFTNIVATKMWIGSLFFTNSDRSQYLWLYGPGGNGKSTLAMIIAEVLGDFVRFEQSPYRDDKYWTHGLIGKRLIILDDCNNYGFVKTGLFKALTGGSKVRVEEKFANPYDTDLDCKFLFTSNELPMVSGDLADQRRIILSTAINKMKFEFDPAFKERLKSELQAFISNCMLLYEKTCGDGRPIPTDASEALDLANMFDEEVDAWVERYFVYSPATLLPVSEFRAYLDRTRLDSRRVYRFLEQQGITRLQVKEAGVNRRMIKGLARRPIAVTEGIWRP